MQPEIEACKTVEEVEATGCNQCSSNGHWGWCDAFWITCERKDRIKQLLGDTSTGCSSFEEHLNSLGINI